jgi:hypothetical protein
MDLKRNQNLRPLSIENKNRMCGVGERPLENTKNETYESRKEE